MTRDVSKRRSPLLFWLPAGAGITAIVTLTGTVLLVQPGHSGSFLADVVVAANQNSFSGPGPQPNAGPVIGLRRGDVGTDALSVPQVLKPVAATPVEPTHSGTHLADVHSMPSAPSETAGQKTPLPNERAAMPLAPLTKVAANNAPTAAPYTGAVVAKQIAPAPAREVETVVVTAPTYQQPAFSVDNVGRGNSLVIQLPRQKRNP